MKPKYTNEVLSRISEVVAASMGLHFPVEQLETLCRNLISAAHEFGFHNNDEFFNWLLTTTLNKDQIETISSYLTISETYFWRERQVFSALTDYILPKLINSKKSKDKTIRIWSAGCSSGEEPYSLAIALHKTIPDLKDWNIKILASDINPEALKKAVSGIYTNWSFRACPDWLKANYFHSVGDGRFEILTEIKNLVTFSNLNLIEDIYPSLKNDTHSMDIIFCRNVLMYFTDDWIKRISHNFFNSLTKDGWFVVSSCELSSDVFPAFHPVNFPGAVLYHKSRKDLLSQIKTPSPIISHDVAFIKVTDMPKNVRPMVRDLNGKPDTVVDQSSFLFETEKVPEDTHISEFEGVSENGLKSDILLNVRLLANKGNLNEALLLCNEGIATYKLSIGLYLLRASIYQELDKVAEAISSLKQAIYLDPNFIMGYFALGNLSISQGNQTNAKKYFNNVLELLNTCAKDAILPESDGLSIKHLREIIHTAMQKHAIL